MKITKTIFVLILFLIPGTDLLAATTDGMLSGLGEYTYNTESKGNSKHYTYGLGTPNSEYDDGSGGDRYDLNYLGVDIGGGQFQFGVVGGGILTDPHLGMPANEIDKKHLYLGDIAINVTDYAKPYQDPTKNMNQSREWNYAVRILSMDTDAGKFTFSVLTADIPQWLGVDIYSRETNGQEGHHTDTFRMENGSAIEDGSGNSEFTGYISTDTDTSDGKDDAVLEGSFDLGLLALFDEKTGGRIITYLTMSCANDEAIVDAYMSPVPLPSAVWLFGSALIGFIGVSRRTRV